MMALSSLPQARSRRAPDSSAPQPPGAWTDRAGCFAYGSIPQRLGPAHAGPFFLFDKNLLQHDLGRADHKLGRTGNAALHHHRGRIDAGGLNILHWDAERLGLAVPIAKLDPAPHHIGVGKAVTAVLAAADRHRNRSGDRAKPDLGLPLLILGRRHRDSQLVAAPLDLNRKRKRRTALALQTNRAFDR